MGKGAPQSPGRPSQRPRGSLGQNRGSPKAGDAGGLAGSGPGGADCRPILLFLAPDGRCCERTGGLGNCRALIGHEPRGAQPSLERENFGRKSREGRGSPGSPPPRSTHRPAGSCGAAEDGLESPRAPPHGGANFLLPGGAQVNLSPRYAVEPDCRLQFNPSRCNREGRSEEGARAGGGTVAPLPSAPGQGGSR